MFGFGIIKIQHSFPHPSLKKGAEKLDCWRTGTPFIIGKSGREKPASKGSHIRASEYWHADHLLRNFVHAFFLISRRS